MGYAAPGQTAAGIYLRLRSRAYVIIGDNGNRIAFVSVDCAMSSQLVTMQVLDRLQAQFGGLYTEQNVCISGTHTHSGPGGFLQYLLFDLTSFGYVRESMDALVDAIYESIVLAHNNVKPASILMNHGNVYNASINRSPTSYLNNPPRSARSTPAMSTRT
jgi:neutral ceramidase